MFKILIAEDDRELRQLFQHVLLKNGYTVKGVSDGQEALNALEKDYYDLIISDMYYPREAGGKEEASGELIIQKVIDQELKVPVILCSSVNLRFSEIFGCVYYNKIRNWEDDLRLLINKLAYQNRRRN